MSIYSQLAGTAKVQASKQSLLNQSFNWDLIGTDWRSCQFCLIGEIKYKMTLTHGALVLKISGSSLRWSEAGWGGPSGLLGQFAKTEARVICGRPRNYGLIFTDLSRSDCVKLPANIVCWTNTKFSASCNGFHVLNLNYKNVKCLNISSDEKWDEQMLNFGKV